MKDIMEKINLASEQINPWYSLSFRDTNTILRCSNGNFDLVLNSFTFGYLQGTKAAKAEMKKARNAK